MAHLFVIVEGREVWMKKFLSDLTNRRYPMKTKRGIVHFEPNVREVKLLDISVPEDSLPYLLRDLAPFIDSNSPIKRKVKWLARLLRLLFGVKPVVGCYEPSEEVRGDWINKVVIGWKKDKFDSRTGMELI